MGLLIAGTQCFKSSLSFFSGFYHSVELTLLDRYHQHTLLCSSCRQALTNIQRIQIGLLIYFAVAVAIAAVIPDHLRLWVSLPLVSTALLGLGIYGWLKYWLEPKFYFVDYVHAER